MNYINLGSIDYASALKIQEDEKVKVKKGLSKGSLFFLQHNPAVITIGQNSSNQNILYSQTILEQKGYQIFKTSRGGDVTVHEPGQLIVYFVVPLHSKSVKIFIESIINIVQIELSKYSIKTEYNKSKPGLWVNNKKICALGFDLKQGVSMHGIAINVCNSLEGFSYIVPCGLHGTSVTSLANECPNNIDFFYFLKGLLESFKTSFKV